MIAAIGTVLLWLLALALIAVFPLTEFARGMASNPSAHRVSHGGCLISLTGIALAVILVLDR